eukprot:698878_1
MSIFIDEPSLGASWRSIVLDLLLLAYNQRYYRRAKNSLEFKFGEDINHIIAFIRCLLTGATKPNVHIGGELSISFTFAVLLSILSNNPILDLAGRVFTGYKLFGRNSDASDGANGY